MICLIWAQLEAVIQLTHPTRQLVVVVQICLYQGESKSHVQGTVYVLVFTVLGVFIHRVVTSWSRVVDRKCYVKWNLHDHVCVGPNHVIAFANYQLVDYSKWSKKRSYRLITIVATFDVRLNQELILDALSVANEPHRCSDNPCLIFNREAGPSVSILC